MFLFTLWLPYLYLYICINLQIVQDFLLFPFLFILTHQTSVVSWWEQNRVHLLIQKFQIVGRISFISISVYYDTPNHCPFETMNPGIT